MTKDQHTTDMERKIIRSLFLLATVFTMGYTRAAEPFRLGKANNENKIERSLERELNRHVIFPVMEEKKDMTGEVFVSFVVNTEGKLVVIDCNSANQELRNYVLRRLERVDIGDNPNGVWKTTRMRFVFRPERA
ncbi:MAG: hypothetical protein R2810_02790 [Flavobacteriales bacterium]|nr:hypothetical protein [Flavobacteriales bacterium]MCB0811843.1 hypothetical protein [Flavobacteriales bacterium]MCB9182086.1 hypothetical protein [Flavobacteriales bacterium]MCB9201327.1 hypothetical protein [Flavobacteriales bacterium]HOP42716.1 hypothetical protein [Flavobacteriales bacterium]